MVKIVYRYRGRDKEKATIPALHFLVLQKRFLKGAVIAAWTPLVTRYIFFLTYQREVSCHECTDTDNDN